MPRHDAQIRKLKAELDQWIREIDAIEFKFRRALADVNAPADAPPRSRGGMRLHPIGPERDWSSDGLSPEALGAWDTLRKSAQEVRAQFEEI